MIDTSMTNTLETFLSQKNVKFNHDSGFLLSYLPCSFLVYVSHISE